MRRVVESSGRQVGKLADIIVAPGNLLEDFGALANVAQVFRDGYWVVRDGVVQPTPPKLRRPEGPGEQAVWCGGPPTSSPGRGVQTGVGPSRGAKPHIAHGARGRGRLRTSTGQPDGAVERLPVCAPWTTPSSSRPGSGSPSGPALFAESLLVPSSPAHVLNLDLLSRCAVHIGMPHAGLLFQYGVVCSAVKNELAAHCVGISQ